LFSGWERAQSSFEASLIPAIDSLRSLGIVWIPGLMAGMLLSGARLAYAAIYQFVLAMIFASLPSASDKPLTQLSLPHWMSKFLSRLETEKAPSGLTLAHCVRVVLAVAPD